MSAVKTYILAPNFTFQPDGAIKLGNIIADPFKPTKTLSTPDPAAQPRETVVTTQLEPTVSHGKSQSLQGSVWAQFLQAASANVGAAASSDVLTSYAMESLDTVFLKYDPTEEEATARVRAARVRAAMDAGLFGRQPVYMITGLKIARGLSLRKETARKREGNAGVSLPVTDQVSLGGNVGVSRGSEVQESFRSGNDVIFAYQLHVITMKGWRKKIVDVDVYTPKSAFLHNDDDKGEEESELASANIATKADLDELLTGDECPRLDIVEATDGDEKCVCIAFKNLDRN